MRNNQKEYKDKHTPEEIQANLDMWAALKDTLDGDGEGSVVCPYCGGESYYDVYPDTSWTDVDEGDFKCYDCGSRH